MKDYIPLVRIVAFGIACFVAMVFAVQSIRDEDHFNNWVQRHGYSSSDFTAHDWERLKHFSDEKEADAYVVSIRTLSELDRQWEESKRHLEYLNQERLLERSRAADARRAVPMRQPKITAEDVLRLSESEAQKFSRRREAGSGMPDSVQGAGPVGTAHTTEDGSQNRPQDR